MDVLAEWDRPNDAHGWPLCEMANLDSSETGISLGQVYISTKNASHGCRIKFAPNPKQPLNCVIMSIPEFVIVVDNLGAKLDNTYRKELMRFAIKHKDKLIDFWNNGNEYNNKKYIDFLSSFTPLTSAEKLAARKLTLVFKK